MVILIFQSAVFLSAFLMFSLEPMWGKAILPYFGGSYLVWTAAVAFFQGTLLLGYAHAHFFQKKLGVARYARWHWILLLAPLLLFPFQLSDLPNHPNRQLFLQVFMVLTARVGLPFYALATASIILQSWLAESQLRQKTNPYILYSSSNCGSIGALSLYPLLFEPLWSIKFQAYIWWIGYGVLLLLFLVCFLFTVNRPNPKTTPDNRIAAKSNPSITTLLKWFLLSASGAALLLSITNIITIDIASAPFLWVLPLIVYLITFIICFGKNFNQPRWIESGLTWCIALGSVLFLMTETRLAIPVIVYILIQMGILFVICMNCHGELIQSKPEASYLTIYYLTIALGGFIGSLAVNLLVPYTTSLIEYPVSMLSVVIALCIARKDGDQDDCNSGKLSLREIQKNLTAAAPPAFTLLVIPFALKALNFPNQITFILIALPILIGMIYVRQNLPRIGYMLAAFILAINFTGELLLNGKMIHKHRNYYGLYKVYEEEGVRYLKHGVTLHGKQFTDGLKQKIPLAYYHPQTPIGRLLSTPIFNFESVGMIGLGTGALATYMDKGQTFKVFEIDPDNLPIADKYFSYLSIAREKGVNMEIVIGDGRISLRQEPDDRFDLIILDAFSSGAIPIHLITTEAFEEYFRALKPDGILVLHISNKYLNLDQLIFSNGFVIGAEVCVNLTDNQSQIQQDSGASPSDWVALTKNKTKYKLLLKNGWRPNPYNRQLPKPWTDQYSNLLEILR